MQTYGQGRLYAATDLVGFLECEHLTALDLTHLKTPLKVAQKDEADVLVQEMGFEHERAYVEHLRSQGLNVVDIAVDNETIEAKVNATLAAMRDGVDVIYQATLLDGCLVGHADFLMKVQRPSALGPHSYEVSDTKFSRTPKAKFIVQLAFYSKLVAIAQEAAPQMMHVVLGDRSVRSYRCADFGHYFDALLARFLAHVEGGCMTPPRSLAATATCADGASCARRQVNLLRQTLPAGARVGTVDKFQGQEAEIVLVSMTTSSEAELPRFMEFLFSKNRLNVAVSRAKCMAILVASPALMTIKCTTPEQMALVNTLCWIAAVGSNEPTRH